MVIGVDGGNSKTDVVLATLAGEPLAYVRGPGSNSHSAGGSAACIDEIAKLIPPDVRAERAVLFLCGADLAHDIEELTALAIAREWAGEVTVDNDTFALLHAGTDATDAIAVICGSGINCVGRAGAKVARYPGLGWETGDVGGAEALGRRALFDAARAADGRGEPTALVDLIEGHFGKAVADLGAEVHYRRMAQARLGELAPAIVASDDAVAQRLVERLAAEIVLLVERALRDLGVEQAEVVLGGGMLAGRGRLFDLVAKRLPAEPLVPELPPVAGAVLAALDRGAAARFREAFRDWEPRG